MKAIAVYTETGTTARLISKYRPQAGVYAFAANPTVCARLNLMWGVQPIWCDMGISTEDMVSTAEKMLLKLHAVQPGDVIAIVAGTRTASGSTNFLRLHVVGAGETHELGHVPERRKMPRLRPVVGLKKK
jgi:pyruvate kinase